jgi:hypothetical protein
MEDSRFLPWKKSLRFLMLSAYASFLVVMGQASGRRESDDEGQYRGLMRAKK